MIKVKEYTELVSVTYIKDGSKAKKGESILVTKERAQILKELGFIKK
jgi:hypothetical protein